MTVLRGGSSPFARARIILECNYSPLIASSRYLLLSILRALWLPTGDTVVDDIEVAQQR